MILFTRIPDYYLLPGLMVSRSFFSPHFGFGKLTGFRRCNAYPIAYRRRKLNECFCYQMEGKSKNITVSISLIFMACCVCFTIICTFFYSDLVFISLVQFPLLSRLRSLSLSPPRSAPLPLSQLPSETCPTFFSPCQFRVHMSQYIKLFGIPIKFVCNILS